MKTTKEPSDGTREFSKKLKEHFSDEEIASFVLTLLGMSEISHYFILKEVIELIILPVRVKYSLIQHASIYRMFGLMVRNELSKGKENIHYMPIGGDAWKSDEDFEQRFILVVKTFHEELKKEGKI